jgi:hypothetical protein
LTCGAIFVSGELVSARGADDDDAKYLVQVCGDTATGGQIKHTAMENKK